MHWFLHQGWSQNSYFWRATSGSIGNFEKNKIISSFKFSCIIWLDFDKRFGDRVGGRGCLFSHIQRGGVCDQCGGRGQIDQAAGRLDTAKYFGHKIVTWNLVRQRIDRHFNTGNIFLYSTPISILKICILCVFRTLWMMPPSLGKLLFI